MKKKIILLICLFFATISVVYAANLTIESKHQSFKMEENKAKFDGDVKVTVDDVIVKGPRAEAFIDPETNKLSEAVFYDNPVAFKDDKNKRSEVRAKVMKLSLITKILSAEGNSKTTITETSKPTTVITADKQEYNTQTRTMKATGHVVVTHDDIKATSDVGYAYLDENNQIKMLEISGNAKITQAENIIQGNKLTYNLVSEIAIATGKTFTNAVMDDGTILKVWAELQQFNKKTKIIMASRNVHIKYEDYDARGPKATAYPDPKTKKINQVVFTGRSVISMDARYITADRITMFLRPKNFFADGNVKTHIPNIENSDDDDGMMTTNKKKKKKKV